jgi:Domain of unknown function (DUF4123)
MAGPAAVPDGAALTAAQLRAALWAGEGRAVFAVIDGAAMAGCAARLAAAEAAAELAGWDCLLPGALKPDEAARASWLAALRQDSPFTDWLLGAAAGAFPNWGLLALTRAPMLKLRAHLRTLNEARTPAGRRVPLRWADPAVAAALLPLCSPSQLGLLFGPVDAWVFPGATRWRWTACRSGQLEQRIHPVIGG